MGPARRPGEQATPTVQRKIGFEFEAAGWNSAELIDPPQLTDQERQQPPGVRRIADDPERWKPLKKKDVIGAGPYFNLEADEIAVTDAHGRSQTDIEFVTAAFDESPQGMDQLNQALDGIVELSAKLSGLRSATHVRDFNFPDELAAIGIGTDATLLKLGGGDVLRGKLQATAGIRLDQVATLMAGLAPARQGEPKGLTKRRRKVRDLMTKRVGGQAQPAPPGQVVMGDAPGRARTAIDRLQASYGVGQNAHDPRITDALQNTAELHGLLSLLVSFLSYADRTPVEYPKAAAALMARTDHAQLYRMLPAEQITLFRWRPALWSHLVADATQLPLASPIFPMRRRPDLPLPVSELTRLRWIERIPRGVDLLTVEGYKMLAEELNPNTLLDDDEFNRYSSMRRESETLEGLGSYGSRTENAGTQAIFELRNIPNDFPYTELKRIARALTEYVDAVNKGKG